jgi:hypothetical protein
MITKAADVARELLSVVETASESLRTISESEAPQRNLPGSWSKKEILGHLLDSAVNNHHRFVRAQQVEELTFPAYDQPHWVSSQGYGERPWPELVDLWRLYNRHLAHVISRAMSHLQSTTLYAMRQFYHENKRAPCWRSS